eukprot:4980617-Pyramimonas_sp.AAC.1
MEPGMLEQSAFLEICGGRVVAPASGTCRPSEHVIDCLVISRQFRAARAEVPTDWEFGPRRPVELIIDGSTIDVWVQ